MFRQAGIGKNLAERIEVKIRHQQTDRLVAGIENGLAELDHHPSCVGQQGIVADGERPAAHGVLKKGTRADMSGGRGRRGGEDAALCVGQGKGYINGVAGEHVGQ